MLSKLRWLVLIFTNCAIISADTTTTISPDMVDYICPKGFDLVRNGQCRGTNNSVSAISVAYNQMLQKAIDVCNPLHAHPITIKNDEEQAYWDNLVYHIIPIGISCNITSKQWQWIDGSTIDYKPAVYDPLLDSPCDPNSNWYLSGTKNRWFQSLSTGSTTMDFNCVSEFKPSTPDGDCVDFGESDSLCYQVSEAGENFADAQKICKSSGYNVASILSAQENSYVRRMAISRGLVNGLMLGASISEKSGTFEWIDGSEWNYTNFLPGFPIDSFGDCLVMDTNDINGKWINSECSSKLPFACSRKPFTEDKCQGANVKEGDVFSTPGFPSDSSIPCDFFLVAHVGKNVELEMLLLEANTCCDHLLLYEGELGGDLIANLTGAMTGGTYRTSKSNVMRVSWQPNGGVNVRGAMMSFASV